MPRQVAAYRIEGEHGNGVVSGDMAEHAQQRYANPREFKMSEPVVVLDVPAISNAKPRESYGNALTSLMIAVPLSCVLWLGIFRLLRAVFH
jgi:hypothetical protein